MPFSEQSDPIWGSAQEIAEGHDDADEYHRDGEAHQVDGHHRWPRTRHLLLAGPCQVMTTGVPSGAWRAISTIMSLGTRMQPLETFCPTSSGLLVPWIAI